MFKKILIANRGEIAVRIIRACREMGIRSVAVFSEADRVSLPVRLADEAICIGPPPPDQSYLSVDAIVEAARRTNSEAIHPGYGFLSENAAFARRLEQEKITFIGPSSRALRVTGDKLRARKLMRKAGIAVIPGTDEPIRDEKKLLAEARKIGFPVILKATAGGGGKGMRLVRREKDFAGSLRLARSESESAFGDGSIYLEAFLEPARHIEVQVLVDRTGQARHLGERECSIQRRHQKLIEESPSPVVDSAKRKELGALAIKACKAAGYLGAGTVEFLRDSKGRFFFMEFNARLQVEHPVTEMVMGIDLVKWQFRIAAGEKLSLPAGEIHPRGAAIECRIYAEDPGRDFSPCPGKIRSLHQPMGPGLREDSGIYAGYEVPIHYDPLVTKLIAWGEDRLEAISRMHRALGEYRILGIETTLPFHREVMEDELFRQGKFDTGYVADLLGRRSMRANGARSEEIAIAGAAIRDYERRLGRPTWRESGDRKAWKIAYRRRQHQSRH
ncbi:MAG: acetyl-CoA carboxylase biotin carboxylase subunit [Acidobacteria bacterium]|nr:acetyl-CoA carboxylase biotin carboxylase subunit [Acidobacteriota bacterium]